jgi:hypothetical protein
MAMSSPASPGRRRLLDRFAGLFEEALRLERRRRRNVLLLVLVMAAAVCCFVVLDGGGGAASNDARSVAVPRMTLASEGLPVLGDDPMISVVGSRLVVTDTDNTKFAGGRVEGTCAAADVDPTTLRVLSVVHGSCGDPALFDQRVIPIVYSPTPRNHPGWGVNALDIRIATVDRAAPLGYRVGPVIVTYPDASDTRAEIIVGDGSLWIYAPTLNPEAQIGELLRVSLSTGRVVDHWQMPSIDRALLAVNADGLWLAPSNESGFPEHASRSQIVADGSLSRVAPGLRTPSQVFDLGGNGARWLVANAQNVWIDAGRPAGTTRLWGFNGPNATPTVRGVKTLGGVQQCGDLGDGFTTVAGGTSGIFCVSNPGPYTEHIQWLSATGGRSTVVASTHTAGGYDFMDNAVEYRGAYYFINPPGDQAAGLSAPTIYRVAPH